MDSGSDERQDLQDSPKNLHSRSGVRPKEPDGASDPAEAHLPHRRTDHPTLLDRRSFGRLYASDNTRFRRAAVVGRRSRTQRFTPTVRLPSAEA
jgi:hypothetical protein